MEHIQTQAYIKARIEALEKLTRMNNEHISKLLYRYRFKSEIISDLQDRVKKLEKKVNKNGNV